LRVTDGMRAMPGAHTHASDGMREVTRAQPSQEHLKSAPQSSSRENKTSNAAQHTQTHRRGKWVMTSIRTHSPGLNGPVLDGRLRQRETRTTRARHTCTHFVTSRPSCRILSEIMPCVWHRARARTQARVSGESRGSERERERPWAAFAETSSYGPPCDPWWHLDARQAESQFARPACARS
jgi:hypothetical protein